MGINDGGFSGDIMFDAFPSIFMIMFCLIAGIIIFSIIKGIQEWNKNNNSPILEVKATVATKRINVSNNTTNVGESNMVHSTSTYHYVTFEVSSGDRMEFLIDGKEYGMLVEGDHGTLTFQGTRYKSFLRE